MTWTTLRVVLLEWPSSSRWLRHLHPDCSDWLGVQLQEDSRWFQTSYIYWGWSHYRDFQGCRNVSVPFPRSVHSYNPYHNELQSKTNRNHWQVISGNTMHLSSILSAMAKAVRTYVNVDLKKKIASKLLSLCHYGLRFLGEFIPLFQPCPIQPCPTSFHICISQSNPESTVDKRSRGVSRHCYYFSKGHLTI